MIEASERFLSDLGRHNYVTPTSYLELLSCTKTLLEAKKAENIKLKKRYMVGLEKLQGSAEQVSPMLRWTDGLIVLFLPRSHQLWRTSSKNLCTVLQITNLLFYIPCQVLCTPHRVPLLTGCWHAS